MTEIIIGIVIFCIVLFMYLHLYFHLKTSNDLEIYELDQMSKDKLEEVCDIRQPVIFSFENEHILKTTNKKYLLDNYGAFELKMRNVKESDETRQMYVPLPIHAAMKLFNDDQTSSYLSENNGEFLQETGVVKSMQYNDNFLRPSMVSNCNYDIMMGSEGTTTPFKYELNYRNFFMVVDGSVSLKLAPPEYSKYLYTNRDYDNFEFRSPVDPWNIQPNYVADFNKMKCLDITLKKGQIIYIPAYWWYSIKFNSNSSINSFKYRTYMNNLAIAPHIAMYALQLQNIKQDNIKKHEEYMSNEPENVEDIHIDENQDKDIHNNARKDEDTKEQIDENEILPANS
tara:strand:+ start:16283 stop:17305 length:1023 start_codon:yes stop_codon:yes gene_type:complete